MDSFEWNKIFGAVLGTGLLVFGLKIVGGTLFHGEEPEKPGYVIATASAETPGTGGEPAAAAVPLPVLLAKADKDKGMAKAKACLACHNIEKGGANKVGPALWDIVGRPMGAAAGFAYSDGFKAMGGKNWGYEELDMWLKAPKEYIPGTKMAYSGISKDDERANVLAYLASLSDAPKAFPK
jgi:cytochrome c